MLFESESGKAIPLSVSRNFDLNNLRMNGLKCSEKFGSTRQFQIKKGI